LFITPVLHRFFHHSYQPITGISLQSFQQSADLNDNVFKQTLTKLFGHFGVHDAEISLDRASSTPPFSFLQDTKELLVSGSTDTVYLTYRISLVLGESNPYTSPTQASQQLSSKLEESTSNGNFTSILQVII